MPIKKHVDAEPRVLCVGELVLDCLAEVAALPEKNHTVFIERISRSIGGGSVDLAIMLSQFDVNVSLLSYYGDNVTPLMPTISSYPIDFSSLSQVDGASSSVFVFFSGTDYFTFFDPGLETGVLVEHLLPDPALYSVICLVGSRLPSYRRFYSKIAAALTAKNQEIVFCPAWSVDLFSRHELETILSKITLLVINQEEYRTLWDRLEQEGLIDLFSRPRVVVETRGSEGCVIHSRGKIDSVPAIPDIRVINPSGAGDAFLAGFVIGLMKGWTLIQSAQLGTSLASFVLEVPQSYAKVSTTQVFQRCQDHFS